MKSKTISEIFLTSNHVSEEQWLEFINCIAKLNGLFKKIEIYILIELNQVRYFVVSSSPLPATISSLNDFLIKKMDDEEIKDFRFYNGFPCIITNKEKNVLDVFDKYETRHKYILKLSKITIMPWRKNHFFTRTRLFFETNHSKKMLSKIALFNIPHSFLSINFAIYSRFFYRKNAIEYLDIQKPLQYLENNQSNSIVKIDAFPYLSDDYYLSQDSYDFDKHSVVIGSSGSGKSKFLCSLIENISTHYHSNYKVVVIDPHAALENDIGGLDNTAIVNFKDLDNSADLFMNSKSDDKLSSTELILSLFQSLMSDLYNSKLERVLRHSIYILIEDQSLNFINLRKLLLDMNYRNSLINKLQNCLPESIYHFFLTDFNELKSQSYQEAIAPIISFIDEMQLLPSFCYEEKLQNIEELIDKNFLTIFSLDQTVLGKKLTQTISGLIMQQILQLIQSYSFHEHIILVIDEVAVVENPILSKFLSEARKYNLSLILAQQYFSQISEDIRMSIFSNVSNFYVFRVSKSDALILESNLHMEVAVHNSYKIRLKILTELRDRECILRLSSNGTLLPAFKAKTLNFVPKPRKTLNQILRTEPLIAQMPILKTNLPTLDSITNNSFSISNSLISLKDIMISQSSSRKDIENFI